MSGRRRRVAVRVAARGVPDGLVALHVQQVPVGADGRPVLPAAQPTGARRVSLAAETPVGELHGGLTHAVAREALSDPERRRSVRDELTGDDVALVLARAGLVRLKAFATVEGGQLTVGDWRTWELTRAGAQWAETYDAVDLDDPVVAAGVRLADELDDGDAQFWAEAVAAESERLLGLCERAAELVDDGGAHGMTVAEFAESVTGDPDGLAPSSELTPLVLGYLARRLGLTEAPTSEDGRARLLEAAGIGGSPLAATVASARLPGGGGAVGALLGAAAAHDIPLLLQMAVVADDGGRPVAPPRTIGWVFAVQHESTFAATLEMPVRTPVVLHGGSTSAVHLLRHAARSGWRIAVVADDDPTSRERQRWLVEKVGDAAVPWGVNGDGAGGLSESADLSALLADIRAGHPA